MKAPVKLIRAVLPTMIENNQGAIVNVSSLGSWMPARGAAMYAATKAFLRVFSRSLKFELVGTDVKVQALCPGFTHTEFHNSKDLKKVKTSTPKILWMNADKVITTSLSALSKDKVVVVPGFVNKVSRWLLTSKLFGKYLVKKLQPKPNFGTD